MSIHLEVTIHDQQLRLMDDQQLLKTYTVSTALNGVGQLNGSGCTPLGRHVIRLKIGAGCQLGAVFVGRRFTGEIYSSALADKFPGRDWILSRILWLSGLESGVNRGLEVDSLKRYIYIHGTPDTEPMGLPRSHGCIRMRNSDVVELFEQVSNNTPVEIKP